MLFQIEQVILTPRFACKVEGFLVANAVVTGWKVCWACKPDQVLPLAHISSVKVRIPEIFHPKACCTHRNESTHLPKPNATEGPGTRPPLGTVHEGASNYQGASIAWGAARAHLTMWIQQSSGHQCAKSSKHWVFMVAK